MKKRRRLALEDLSGDEEDSGDEYVPGNFCILITNSNVKETMLCIVLIMH